MTVHYAAQTATAHHSPAVLGGVPRKLLIGGRWRAATAGDTMPVQNPATAETLTYVADAGVADAEAAVAAAAAAQHGWERTAPRVRSEILRRSYELMIERVDLLAEIMTLEMGKPIAEARGEVLYAAHIIRWFAEEAVRIDGGYSHRPDGAARTVQLKQPVGPCLLIVPWNFPLAMGARKVGPAIAAGCTSILKPAPQTPLSSLALAQIMTEAGLPDGVLNVLTTSRAPEIVPPILSSGRIRKMSFTGSTAVGKLLLQQSTEHVIRTSMELGGNAPFIVLADADLDIAVDAAFDAKMRNMGEACTAANRFFVHETIADEFATRLGARMSRLIVGDGRRDGVQVGPMIDQVGPMIDQAAQDKVTRLTRDALERGASMVRSGRIPEGPGYFAAPTVLAGVPADAELNFTEIFGPLAAISTFTDVDDAIVRANDTEWGLVGYLITRDIDQALNISERLEVGTVGLNTGIVSTPSAPFGGIKQSGLGREGGRAGIEEYLEIKYISIPVRR